MRKMMIVFFALMAIMMMTMPAYAQGGNAAAPATNWVAIASGFGMAIAAGLAALGQGRVGAAACEGMARNPAARPAYSAGTDSGPGVHRVPGAVHAGYYLRQSRLVRFQTNGAPLHAGRFFVPADVV